MKTKDKLAQALTEAKAPADMIQRASAGYYDEFESVIKDPIHQLIIDARASGLQDIADKAIKGEFDATSEEGDAWFRSMNPFQDLSDAGIDPFKE